MALVSAALILLSQSESESQIVHSDHLQSVCLIEDIWANALHPNFWAYKPAQSYYQWLHNITPLVPPFNMSKLTLLQQMSLLI